MQLTVWPSRCWTAAPPSVNVRRAVILKLNRREECICFFFGVSLALIVFMHGFAVWFVPSVKVRFITVSL